MLDTPHTHTCTFYSYINIYIHDLIYVLSIIPIVIYNLVHYKT